MKIKVSFDSYEEMLAFCSGAAEYARVSKEIEAIDPFQPEAAAVPEEDQAPAEKVEIAEEDPIEEEAPAKEYTKIEVRGFLAKLQKEGKKQEVTELINSLGYAKFSEVPEDKYPELMKKAGEL